MTESRSPEQAARERAQIVARAWLDKAFREALMRDPKAAISQELGRELADGVEITVLQETASQVYLVIPPAPDHELSEQELEHVSGGLLTLDSALLSPTLSPTVNRTLIAPTSWVCGGGGIC